MSVGQKTESDLKAGFNGCLNCFCNLSIWSEYGLTIPSSVHRSRLRKLKDLKERENDSGISRDSFTILFRASIKEGINEHVVFHDWRSGYGLELLV